MATGFHYRTVNDLRRSDVEFSPSFEHRGAQRTKDGLSSHQHMSITV